MDYQVLFNFAMVAVAGAAGWILGRITKALDALDADVRAMPSTYVSKVDYRSDIHDVKMALVRIENKLDGKADKP